MDGEPAGLVYAGLLQQIGTSSGWCPNSAYRQCHVDSWAVTRAHVPLPLKSLVLLACCHGTSPRIVPAQGRRGPTRLMSQVRILLRLPPKNA